jgi:hypothetical protein
VTGFPSSRTASRCSGDCWAKRDFAAIPLIQIGDDVCPRTFQADVRWRTSLIESSRARGVVLPAGSLPCFTPRPSRSACAGGADEAAEGHRADRGHGGVAERGSAQQARRTVAVLMPYPPDDEEVRARVAAFRDELRRLGWPDDALHVEERWSRDDLKRVRADAAELVQLKPDVIFFTGGRWSGSFRSRPAPFRPFSSG